MRPFQPVFVFVLFSAAAISTGGQVLGQQALFDVPAILPAVLIDVVGSNSTDTIHVEVPVSILQKQSKGIELEELFIAVYWSSEANLVCDFSPKTILASEIEGTILVQQQQESSTTAGIDANGKYSNVIGVSGKLQSSGTKRESQTFHRLPHQELLTASGFIKRGTGAYFKFRASSQTTLEGTHLVMLSFKVPKSWRAGLLRVDCQLKGKRRGYTSLDTTEFTQNTEFVSVVHLTDDILAYELASKYVDAENQLLAIQKQFRSKTPSMLTSTFDSSQKRANELFNWCRQIVYANSDQIIKDLPDEIPGNVRVVAKDLVTARTQLTQLTR
ncbi:MAG TPA: hypothetical protein PKD64_12330 [Pirellulaceae bacterium]|nr:hypothetical protein [Pirellulaceae bacterium]HMO92974.1 hypothetical protein [Pirellulaceae bacterium]HMP67948.1 hypothetical protein [Pirellulaceae bacterium]